MNERSHQSLLSIAVLSQIQNYLVENDGLILKLFGFTAEITVNNYAFPSSFDDDETQSQLKQLKYKSSVQLLNAAYRKLGITELSKAEIKQCLEGELEYWYLHISFGTPIPPELQDHCKTQNHNFMIFLGDPESGDDPTDKDWRILYSPQMIFNYVQEFDRAIYLDLDDSELDEKYKSAISQLESAIYGICRTIEIEIPQSLQSEALDRLTIQPPTLATFASLLKLVTRDLYDDAEYQADAQQLQEFHQEIAEDWEMSDMAREILDRYDAIYYSDWKFDPEDVKSALAELLADEEFTFEYPEDTYAHNLFPYIQTELAKRALTMLNIDTCGDSYLFFIANIIDVGNILELAQKIDLRIERV
jgi:hypothetical protein